MKSQLFISEPTSLCPFRVEGVQYLPASPCEDGFTLVFFHAMNLHKETYEPMVDLLLERSNNIRDVWCIDNPNHGRSASLNQTLLETPQYHKYWSATEYTRAVYSFLSSPVHGVDFCSRWLVGLAHSSSVAVLMKLIGDSEYSSPSGTRLKFTSLILLDPALLPPEFPSTTVLTKLFGHLAKTKRDKWSDREAAHKYLAARPAFKTWDPRAIRLFVECALRESGSGSGVVLSCTKAQEVAFYLNPDEDYKERPVQIFRELIQRNELPIHIIVCLNDEFKGQARPSKDFQIEQIKSTTRGSVQILDRGGHMFPQVEPALCADAIHRALASTETRARL
ncbi:Alpha/beta hydrolase fold-1 [Favolaschia claudopus]|uniref:Alpha/beta hydrolase fold-1 n=1 Tax=Favolaschia claudopus TaxID=2862362 RepID=A0AAV9ZTU2_9AGAR